MTAEELRALQAPLKQRYRDQSEAALVTLKAEGRLGEGVTCRLETRQAMIEAGLHEAAGGAGVSACSGDMLLEALVACAGVTLAAVATALEIPVRDAVIRAEAELDFRGTLGVEKSAPVGLQAIRLHFEIDSDAGPEQVANVLRLTERYCVIYQTLQRPAGVELSWSFAER
jgi:uncharacterized OsmC-like protein